MGRKLEEDSLISLRLRAADLLCLSDDSKNEAIERELEYLATHYVELARKLEKQRAQLPVRSTSLRYLQTRR